MRRVLKSMISVVLTSVMKIWVVMKMMVMVEIAIVMERIRIVMMMVIVIVIVMERIRNVTMMVMMMPVTINWQKIQHAKSERKIHIERFKTDLSVHRNKWTRRFIYTDKKLIVFMLENTVTT